MITKEMTLLSIIEKYPETEDVFHQYDKIIGECLLCNNLFDTIETVSNKYKINMDNILEKLNIE
ncbi:hypothetical protein AAIB48_13075 [Paraclostridium benzoelyticum]|uniref:hypothetical protein n=1 Tax=Paraclostridium benzoelyticum TaxID=1629550 RepID=UPI0031CD11C0